MRRLRLVHHEQAVAQCRFRVQVDARAQAEVEVELTGQRGVLPGNLPPLRRRAQRVAHALEHGLDGAVGRRQVLQQRLGVGAIAATSIVRGLPRRRGEGDQGALGRIHRSEPARLDGAAPRALEGIVPAGIEDDDAGGALGLLHHLDHTVQRE